MMKKDVESDGRGGLREVWVGLDGARAKPLPGHDRPTALLAITAQGTGNVALGQGIRQISLGRAA